MRTAPNKDTAPRRLALFAWVVGLAAVEAALVQVGGGPPGSPPVGDPARWADWASGHEALDVATGVVRVVAIVLVGYLLAVTALQLLLAGRGPARMRRVIRRASPRFLATLTAAAIAAAGPAGAEESSRGASSTAAPATPTGQAQRGLGATMELLDAESGTSLPWAGASAAGEASDPPERAAEHDPHEHRGPSTGSRDDRGTVDSTEGRDDVADAPWVGGEWVVQPGDHLWGIAEQIVSSPDGSADEQQVHDYWVRLVDANRDRLVDPGNADLILPGQRLRLP